MRFVINCLIALMLVGILAGVMYHHNLQQEQHQAMQQVRDDVRVLRRQIMLQATLRLVDLSEAGYPLTVDPAWFEENLPANALISPAHPWMEIAHEDHRDLEHPPTKVAAGASVARFWYNPANGRVRARVPAMTSDAAALQMYNFINDANVSQLFEDDPLSALDPR